MSFNIKYVILAGTIAVAVTFGSATAATPRQADADTGLSKWAAAQTEEPGDTLLDALQLNQERELYDQLYEGHTLADIAAAGGGDAEKVIALQVSQLQDQLDARLAGGDITYEQYRLQSEELPDIIRSSVYGT